LKMNIDLPPWPKPQEDDIAKVNIRILFKHHDHTIGSSHGQSARSSRLSPSDVTFSERDPVTNKLISIADAASLQYARIYDDTEKLNQ